jgi:hypothetical protein
MPASNGKSKCLLTSYGSNRVASTKPPEGRLLMVAGLEVFVEIDGQRIGLSPQRYLDEIS